MSIRDICVIGLGYIGLPTSALLASRGFKVHGVDINEHAVATINKGRIHIIEPGLEEMVKSGVDAGLIEASTKPEAADVFFICVPTPFKAEKGRDHPIPDLSFVEQAARSIAPYVRKGNIVILESTSPVGSTEIVADILAKEGVPVGEVLFAYCPERVLPGQIMKELVENDRIVGGLTEAATASVAEFYRRFVKGEVMETDCRSAEMCKLVENSSRDVQIAFANEISMLCDRMGVDVWKVRELANHHPRVNILRPGSGVGGHCIAVDPWFLVAHDPETTRVIRSARETNKRKTQWVIEKIVGKAEELRKASGKEPKIACMGVAFKPDIDDLRESPSLEIARSLQGTFKDLVIVEPNVDRLEGLRLASLEEAVSTCDILVYLVAHKSFKAARPATKAAIIDVCGVWTP